jgi:hypothetical protein
VPLPQQATIIAITITAAALAEEEGMGGLGEAAGERTTGL